MRSTIITIATIAAAAIGLLACEEINQGGEEALQEQIKKEVRSNRTEESKEAFKLLEEYKSQQRDRDARENAEFNRRMIEYKETSGYNRAVKEVDEQICSAVDSYMKATKYEETKIQAKKDRDEAIAEWKKANYIQQYKEQKDRIENAKKEAKNHEFYASLTSSNSDDSKEMAEKVKEAVAEKEEEIRADAKKAIKKLEKRLAEVEREQNQIYTDKVKELDKGVDDVRNEVVKTTAPTMSELEKKLSNKRDEVRSALRAKRTDEEKEIESEIELYSSKCNRYRQKEIVEIQKRLSEATKADEVAAYFKAKKWSKLGAGAFLVLPFVPVMYVGYKYAGFVSSVLQKM